MNNIKFFVTAFLAFSLLISCNEDDDITIAIDDETFEEMPDHFENGYLVTHEGAFSGGFGTVSYLNEELTSAENDIYQSVNDDNLGGIVQSIAFSEDLAFIVSNLSNRVTVVDRFTFEEVARVDTGLSNPRYMAIAGDKGYITNWGDGSNADDDFVSVVDLDSFSITSTIMVSEGPEQILSNGTSLYVTHKGGFSVNNVVSVIDPISDTVETTITVGDAPDDLELDSEGNLWVLSKGTLDFQGEETGGRFTKINTETNEPIVTTILANDTHPSYMDIDNESIYYYLNGNVYRAGIEDDLSTAISPIIEGLSFYGMTVDNGRLIGCNAGDFNSNGSIEVYSLDTNTLINSLEVGLIPAKVYSNF